VWTDATLGGGFRFALSIDMDWGAVDAIPETLKQCLLGSASSRESGQTAASASCVSRIWVAEFKPGFRPTPWSSCRRPGSCSLDRQR
jgi:hypothetical protein